MPKRVITAAVGVAGLVVIGLGVASATVWRADDVLVATTTTTDHLIVTDPGVLELGGDPVTVRATTSGGDPVVLAIGRDTDVAGWVGTDAHAQVTGLAGWHELESSSVPAGPSASASPSASGSPSPSASPSSGSGTDEAAAVADPAGSDLWVAQATGDGSARLVWPAQSGRWSLLVAGTGDSAPTLSLSWPRVVTTPWLWPLVVLGSLLALGAAALLARDWNRRRTGTQEPEWHPVTTGAMSTVGEPGTLTRRQIREAELARTARPRTGAVPRVGTPARGTPQAAPAPETSPVASATDHSENDTVVLRAVPPQDGPPARAASEPVASAPVPAAPGVPTRAVPTRRALRTGAIPVVSAGQQPVQQGATATPSSPAAPEDDAATPKPAWLRGRRGAAAPAQAPAGPMTSSAGEPSAVRASTAGASVPASSDASTPASVAPDARDGASDATEVIGTVPARPATGPSAPPPPPGAWVPTPPPSSAAAAPASGPRSVSRPTWLPTTAPGGDQPPAAPRPPAPAPRSSSPEASAGATSPERTSAEAASAEATSAEGTSPAGADPAEQTAGSRADAWRRAWGLPSTDEPTTEQGEDR